MKKLKRINWIILFSLLLLICIILISGFNLNKYGINKLCSAIGGIWCYWPSWSRVFIITIIILGIILILLSIVFIIRKLNKK
jgi:hypothetical protein